MDFKKAPNGSGNLTDRTGDNELQRFLNYILVKLNPVYAYRNIRNTDGVIPQSQGIDIRKKKKRGNSKALGEGSTY